VHDGNLSGRPAKTDEAELEPEAQGFAETGMRHFALFKIFPTDEKRPTDNATTESGKPRGSKTHNKCSLNHVVIPEESFLIRALDLDSKKILPE
jgi:hypothetical protein